MYNKNDAFMTVSGLPMHLEGYDETFHVNAAAEMLSFVTLRT